MLVDGKNKMLNSIFVVGVEGVHITMESTKITSVSKDFIRSIWICNNSGFTRMSIFARRSKERIQRQFQIPCNGQTRVEITNVRMIGVAGLQECGIADAVIIPFFIRIGRSIFIINSLIQSIWCKPRFVDCTDNAFLDGSTVLGTILTVSCIVGLLLRAHADTPFGNL